MQVAHLLCAAATANYSCKKRTIWLKLEVSLVSTACLPNKLDPGIPMQIGGKNRAFFLNLIVKAIN